MTWYVRLVNSLSELLKGFVDTPISETLHVTGLSLDSRSTKHGDLFIGLPGFQSDGRSYVQEAILAGAKAVLIEAQSGSGSKTDTSYYQIENLRKYIGWIASRFYDFPSRLLSVIGFTGTNGKTTCAVLTAQALEALGCNSGVIGTLGSGRVNCLRPAKLTTPDAISLQAELAHMVDAGLDSVCIEVSSHALDQGRVEAVDFDAAVFTNLSRDHLDYHGNMDSYVATKFRLFHEYDPQVAIINICDPCGEKLSKTNIPAEIFTYGFDSVADVYPKEHNLSKRKIELRLSTPVGDIYFKTSLLGRVNILNLVAVVTTLLALDYPREAIEDVMSTLRPIPGRMELVTALDDPIHVVIDYAHTPAALEQTLRSLREYTPQRIWCVFGCGGSRDVGKRSEMGAVADRLADEVILTNDNPRDEDPFEILEQINLGIRRLTALCIPDRKEAISHAICHATSGDLILVAGKGNESEQIVGAEHIPFSDRSVITNLLGGIC